MANHSLINHSAENITRKCAPIWKQLTIFAHSKQNNDMDQEFASSLLEQAVSQFASLPGIGR